MSDTEPRHEDQDTDLKKVIEKNPQVDADQLREAHELLTRLRRGGLDAPTYRIVSPYERRSVYRPD